MDPNQYNAGYHAGAYSSAEDYSGQQSYDDDFNDALLMHPEMMEDPAWYASFDYGAGDAAGDQIAWDHTQEYEGYYETAGGDGSGAGKKDKGKEKSKSKDKDKPKSKGKDQPEIRFKNDMASSSDWDTHRETIRDLYMTQKLSLKDVMEVMRNTHGFAAT
jgi:hypothetical protein